MTNEELQKFLDQVDAKLAKGQEVTAETRKQLEEAVKAHNTDLSAKVAQLSEDLGKKDITIGEMQAKVNDFIAKQGKLGAAAQEQEDFRNIGHMAAKMIGDNIDAFGEMAKTKSFRPLEMKADMTTSGTLTGNSALTQFNRSPLLFPVNRHMRSIINVVGSDTLVVDYPREVVPAQTGSVGPQTEGNDKANLEYDVQMVNLALDYEAGYATVTRQMLTNIPWLNTYLSRKLTEAFYSREDVKALNFMDSLATASGSAATVAAEAIIDMIAEVDDAGYGANGILTTPSKWAAILKTKPSDYSIPGGVQIGLDGQILIGGLPLFKHQNLTANKIYVGAWETLYIVQGGSLSLRSSDQHASNFIQNKITFLLEAPIGIAMENAKAIVKKTVA